MQKFVYAKINFAKGEQKMQSSDDPKKVLEWINVYFKFDNGVFYWTENAPRGRHPGAVAGCKDFTAGRWLQYVLSKNMPRAKLVWLMAHGDWPPSKLYHINGDIYDDRLENLSLTKPLKVQMTAKVERGRPQKALPEETIPGLVFMPRRNQWRLEVNGRLIGFFQTRKMAELNRVMELKLSRSA